MTLAFFELEHLLLRARLLHSLRLVHPSMVELCSFLGMQHLSVAVREELKTGFVIQGTAHNESIAGWNKNLNSGSFRRGLRRLLYNEDTKVDKKTLCKLMGLRGERAEWW
jgi:hypothetical protein